MFRSSIRIAAMSITVFAVLGLGSAARASSSFDLTGSGLFGSSQSSYTFTNNGITLTVTGTQSSWSGPKDAKVHQSFAGLGVGHGWLGDLDGVIGKGETLWLEFSETVMLTGALFSYAGLGDEVRFVDEKGDLIGDIDLWPSLFGFKLINLDGTLDLIGTKFGLTVTDSNDNFKLKHLSLTSYEDIDATPIAAVPLPAAVWPGLLMMAGLALIHRVRRQPA